MSILQTKNLTKKFEGVHAVDRLNIEIQKGAITSIIGPNGAGKTTLINLLSGMLPFDEGMLIIDNKNHLSRLRPYQAPTYGITRTFQNVRLFEQMSVLDNVLVVLTERNFIRALFERHGQEHLQKAKDILFRLGIWEKKNELAVNLSYGQRKLLEIGRALAMDTKIILFDEPFAGLFKEMVRTVVSVIKELKKQGKTIVLIEHNMELIRELSDHLIVMDSGTLLAEGAPAKVLLQPEVIEAYLGE